MAIGLYIHVPFCIKKCNYCDFISYPYDAGLAASYVCALEKELAMHSALLSGERRKLQSIYLGGGTPTLLSVEQLSSLLETCAGHFELAGDAEITIECNPGTVDLAKLAGIRAAGVNRISIGVQASQEHLLARLGRIHGWPEVEQTARWSRQAGIANISFDLIFGIPGQTMKDWQESLDCIMQFSPQHISAYNLKIEPNTPLYADAARGLLAPFDEDLELAMFWYVIETLTRNRYQHYEISNFAQPGFESRHNLIYWRNNEYLGAGPGAHSMINLKRFNNVELVASYIDRLNLGLSPVQAENLLTREDEIAETVFLGLRLIQGLDLSSFEQRFGQSIKQLFPGQLTKLKNAGLIKIEENCLQLTAKALPIANEVFAEFI